MSKKLKDEHVKYYRIADMTPEEMMEDYFAEEEAAKIDAIKESGYKFVGSFNKDTTDAEMDDLVNRIVAEME